MSFNDDSYESRSKLMPVSAVLLDVLPITGRAMAVILPVVHAIGSAVGPAVVASPIIEAARASHGRPRQC